MSEERLAPFLLLFLRDEGSYSYQLEEKLDELGFDGMSPGEAYRVLWQMEKEGMVLCDREGGGFRLPQRWFELTEVGKAYLESWAASIAEHREEVDFSFLLYEESHGRKAS